MSRGISGGATSSGIFAAALVGTMVMLAAAVAGAATTIMVKSTADTSTTACVLRDAISVANAGGGTVHGCTANKDTAFTIDFQSGVRGTITLGSPLPTIIGNITINGPATSPGIIISGNKRAQGVRSRDF